MQEDGLPHILEEDGCGDGMCNVAGSQCIKEKPEDHSQVSFVCLCLMVNFLFANYLSLSPIVTRYFAAEFGGCLVVPEAQIDAFGHDHVPPVPGSFKDHATGKKIHFWTKPIAQLLEVSVFTYAQEKQVATDKAALSWLQSMDVVLGGDHGQGKFRSVIKIILRDGIGKQVDSMVMKVGNIDCTKGTYGVLKSSVAGPLNKSMKEDSILGGYN